MNVVIVIPVYKNIPSKDEKISLLRCAEIFSTRNIKLVCPESLDIDEYKKIFSNCNFEPVLFKNFWFNTVANYSKLLLTKDFYLRFSDYDFMLIYQPDAWVFQDELDYWCSCDYSYIGAPWFSNDVMLDIAGNGGFSLRKISDMIRFLSNNKKMKFSLSEFHFIFHKSKKIVKIPLFCFKYLAHLFKNFNFWKNTKLNEDFAIVKYANLFDSDFKIAPPQVAMKFSFEVNPELLYKMNGEKLPFGCHAYLKYCPEFWKKFLTISDQSLKE